MTAERQASAPLSERGAAPAPAARAVELAALAAAAALVVAVAVGGMVLTGAFATGRALLDPGDAVTYGIPIARGIHDCAAVVTVGLLTVATFLLPAQRRVAGVVGFAQWKALRWAGGCGLLWAVAAAAVVVLEGVQVSGVRPGSPEFWPVFAQYLFTVPLGQSLLVSLLCVAAASTLALVAWRTNAMDAAWLFSVLALLPLALSGHAGGSLEHGNAVDSLAVHLLGATVWAGGLVALVLLHGRIGEALPRVVERYSALAAWMFGLVAVSGIVNASLRVGSLDQLLAPYGLLVVAKGALLVLLGAAGFGHRRVSIPRLRASGGSSRPFVRFAAGEVLVLGLTFGVAVALSKSPPPVPQTPLTGDQAREGLIGYPFPPPFSLSHLVTQWHVNWMWAGLAVVLAAAYLRQLGVLRRRGGSWPSGRAIAWLVACALLLWFTSGGPATYRPLNLGVHAFDHLGLIMLAAPLFAMGRLGDLLTETVAPRGDGSRGVREWVRVIRRWMLRQPTLRPVPIAVVFMLTMTVSYMTPVLGWTMRTHTGHTVMTVAMLVLGYLFASAVMRPSALPHRGRARRVSAFVVVWVGHIALGLAMAGFSGVLAADWWRALGLESERALLAQQFAAGLVFAIGSSLVMAVMLALLLWRERTGARTIGVALRK